MSLRSKPLYDPSLFEILLPCIKPLGDMGLAAFTS
jgi:hypothetical protein